MATPIGQYTAGVSLMATSNLAKNQKNSFFCEKSFNTIRPVKGRSLKP